MTRIRIFFRTYWILLLIVAAKFILQYVLLDPYYELHRDEFLHLDQARHPAFGFISVPPFTSMISKLIFLLGGDVFWIRFFPALFGALTIVFAWLIVDTLRGKTSAKILVSLALLFSVLIRLNILFQPNSFDILVWTVAFFFIIKYLDSGKEKWLIFFAVAIVLGLYNKYTVAFLIAGILAGLLLTPQRKILFSMSFLKAALIAFLLFLPNIIWQFANGFPVIEHMRVLKENQLDNISITDFFRGQLVIFLGSLPLTIAALAAGVFYKPFRPYRFAVICFVIVLLVFGLLNAKDYYSLGLYPVIVAIGGVFLENVLSRQWKIFVIPLLIVMNIALFAGVAKFVMPVLTPSQIMDNREIFEKTGMLRWEDGKNHDLPQDFADMTGWKEMADKALTAFNMISPAEQVTTLVFCDNSGQTGALNYYNRGKMKEAYSFNTDYIYWIPRMDHISNVILVGKPDPETAAMFKKFQEIGLVENEYARERGTGIYLFEGADPSFTGFFYDEMEKRKNELDIF
jgi:hypothetical protein